MDQSQVLKMKLFKRFTINRNTGSDGFIDKFYQTFTEELTLIFLKLSPKVVVVQSLSHVQLFVTPWTAAHQASLPLTISWSWPKFMSIASVMPPSHLIFCPHSVPASGTFPMSQLFTFSSVQSLSHVWLFATPWITARQASLSITNSRSSLQLMSIKSVMPSAISSSVVPFSSCPQSLPASESFPMSQSLHEVAKVLEFQL